MKYEPVIGLEVHAQVHTHSKMFCACPVVEDTGDLSPNTYVCPICLAFPGTLPVVNRRAVEVGMRTALALNCTIQTVNVFARKSYFYPDLPKGYQISQYALPLATQGYLEIETEAGPRKIGITRVHLEEDTGKLYHKADAVLVDFNRAGVPLLEIVSEPDMRTVEEVRAYATALRDILVYLGVNPGDMEKGEMRFEANISLRPGDMAGSDQFGIRVEVKNLNSFRALTQAVTYEIERQASMLDKGDVVLQQTMGWDETRNETFPQRSKEYAHDYRYFPEPDIPPLEISSQWISGMASQVPELPLAKQRRLVTVYDIRPYDAALLVAERAIADYFEDAAKLGREKDVHPQEISNWMLGELFRLLNERNVSVQNVQATPQHLVSLIALRRAETINANAAKRVLQEIFETGEDPQSVVDRLGLAQISDMDALSKVVAEVIDANPDQVEQYLGGKTAVSGWFIGQVMRATRGKANPQEVQDLIVAYLEQKRSC